mgnify:CR=1 FL=1
MMCDVVALKTDGFPELNNLCSNSVHPFFIWTQAHIDEDVLNKLAEYKSTEVKHLYFISERKIEEECYVLHKNRVLKVYKYCGNRISIYDYPNIDIHIDMCKRIEATTDTSLGLPVIDFFDVKTFVTNGGELDRVKIKISEQKNTIQVFAFSSNTNSIEVRFSSLDSILNNYFTHKGERDMLCDMIGDKVVEWYKSDNENSTQAGNLVIQELNKHGWHIVRKEQVQFTPNNENGLV